MISRNVYTGSRRKLVLAFDIGTTFSGISYSVLDPGQTPAIKGVMWYPAQELISRASKIPTIIYYDRAGKVRAVGAEATQEGIYKEAKDGEWFKSEWFKLHLRSKFGAGKNITDDIPPLPHKKSVIQVFADFLLYLLECASSYIRETEPNGEKLWKSVQNDIDFVLSHPNGWESEEQSQMCQAAVLAKLIPNTMIGHARLSFVTEGEASLHFALPEDGLLASIIKEGEGVVTVDAGGGTIDISSYRKTVQGHTYEEIAPPQCHFHGSISVSICARVFLSKFLSESDFLDDLDTIVTNFDKTTKVKFKNDEDPQYIKFGFAHDNDPHCNIRSGQLKLSGSDVASFFKPSIDYIVDAVLDQSKSSHHTISHIVLVGGFAASDWLFRAVERSMSRHGLTVIQPDNHVNKAVSDGAISFYLNTTGVLSAKTTNSNADSGNAIQDLALNTIQVIHASQTPTIYNNNGANHKSNDKKQRVIKSPPTWMTKSNADNGSSVEDLGEGSANQALVVSSATQKTVMVGWQGNSKADFDFDLAGLFEDPENQPDAASSVMQSSVVPAGLEGSSEANHDSDAKQHVANVLSPDLKMTASNAEHSIQRLSKDIAKNLQIYGNGNHINLILQNYEKQTIIGNSYNDLGKQGDTFTGAITNATVGGRENSNRLINNGTLDNSDQSAKLSAASQRGAL